MVMDEDRFYLDGAKKALVGDGTIVAIESDNGFFRGDIAGGERFTPKKKKKEETNSLQRNLVFPHGVVG